MYDFESVQMRALEPVELVAKQHVGFGNVGIDQSGMRSVCWVIERVVHELVDGQMTAAVASSDGSRE
jgi:hypothetical protein